MTTDELDQLFLGTADEQAAYEWQDDLVLQDEFPPECQRCGYEFGGGAVLVGDRWVCTPCEPLEYADYDTEQADWLAIHLDLEEDRAKEEAW